MSDRALAVAVVALLLLATLGEGGATPPALLLTHGAVVALALWLLLGPARRGPGPPRAFPLPPLVPFAVFLGFALIGAAAAPYAYAAVLVLIEIAVFAAVLLLAARSGAEVLRVACLPVLAWGGVEGLLALVQRARGASLPAGTFLNPNHLAGWLAASLFLGLAGRSWWRARASRSVRLALAIPAVAALVLSGSRGAFLGLVAGCLAIVSTLWPKLARRTRLVAVAVAVGVLIAAAAGIAFRYRTADPYRYHRLSIWRASLGAAVSSPWLGTGPGQFKVAAANLNFADDTGPLRYERSFTSTHSDLLRLPCEFGWPAAFAALAGVLLAASLLRRRLLRDDCPEETTGAAAALVALAAQAAVENLSERPAIAILAAALLGGALSIPILPAGRRRLCARAAAATVVVVGFAVADVAPFLSWWGVRSLPHERLDDAGRARLESALSLNPLHPDLWLRKAEDLAGDGHDWGAPVYALAREAAEHAIRLEPADSRYRLGLARVEALACITLFRDEATRSRAAADYAAASSLSRPDPFIPLEEGEFLLTAGDPARAIEAAGHALAIEPLAIPARLLAARAELARGGEGSARRAAEHVDEAERVAAKWASWPKESGYARSLLTLDPRVLRGVRSAIAAAAESPRTGTP